MKELERIGDLEMEFAEEDVELGLMDERMGLLCGVVLGVGDRAIWSSCWWWMRI